MRAFLSSPGGRETRLLLVTLALSLLLLTALARLRFPGADPETEAPPALRTAPLERLAARATFDELAHIMTSVSRRVAPSTLVLELVTVGSGEALTGEWVSRLAPALRIRDDMVLVGMQPDEQAMRVIGPEPGGTELVARDDVKGLAVVRVPAAAAPTLSLVARAETDTPARYVALVEASRSGPSVRPLFLGKPDPVTDLRWDEPLMSLGGSLTAPAGSFVFTLDGQFVGLTVIDNGLPALVAAPMVLAAAEPLVAGTFRPRGDLGILWQRLTPALARATGASNGVVVASVDPDGPAASQLGPGDVVERIDDSAIKSVGDARLATARVAPGDTASLRVVRDGARTDLNVVARPAPATPERPAPSSLGVTFRPARGGLEVIRIAADSAAAEAGLLPGDLITQIDRQPATDAAALARGWIAAEPGRAWLLAVTRGGVRRVLALEKR